MNNQEQIKVIEDKIKELQEEVEKLKQQSKWIPKYRECYYYVDTTDYSITACRYLDDKTDKIIIKYNKLFKTEKEAQDYADYLKAKKEYSYDFSTEEWNNDNIKKYSFQYYYPTNDLTLNECSVLKDMNGIYFKNNNQAIKFMRNYRKQILKYEFGVDE